MALIEVCDVIQDGRLFGTFLHVSSESEKQSLCCFLAEGERTIPSSLLRLWVKLKANLMIPLPPPLPFKKVSNYGHIFYRSFHHDYLVSEERKQSLQFRLTCLYMFSTLIKY